MNGCTENKLCVCPPFPKASAEVANELENCAPAPALTDWLNKLYILEKQLE